MGRDSVATRHGRSYNLPVALANRGHAITSVMVDYHGSRTERRFYKEGVEWWTVRFFFPFLRIPRPLKCALAIGRAMVGAKPRVVIGGGDAFNVIFGYLAARYLGVGYVADLKDNYLSFRGTYWIPMIKRLYLYVLNKADHVICVSEPLANYIKAGCDGPVSVVANAVTKEFSRRLCTKEEARSRLGLPADAYLIGTAGRLTEARGFSVVGEAVDRLNESGFPVCLVVAGTGCREVSLRSTGRLYKMGILDPLDVAELFCSLDLGLIMNKDNRFGQFCYPQKFNEMRRCGLPVGAARVGIFEVGDLEGVSFTFEPDSPDDLARRIRRFFYVGTGEYRPVSVTWEDRAQQIEWILEEVLQTRERGRGCDFGGD